MAKKPAGAVQISRKGMLVWIGLFLFVATWMFVLGIMVGRGIAPVDLEKDKLGQELAALKAKMLQQAQTKEKEQVTGQGGEKPDLGFYEALKDPQGEKRYKMPPAPKPKQKPQPTPKRVPAEHKTPVPGPQVKAVRVPPKPPTKATAPQKPAAADSDRFAIQVAAVKNVKGAKSLVAKLREKGFRAYQIRSVKDEQEVWFRVRVGAYEHRDAAKVALGKLQAAGYSGLIISTQ